MMEAELVQAKDFLQNIFDSSISGIMTTDLKGNMVFTTANVKDILGYDRMECIGKKVYTFYPDGRKDVKCKIDLPVLHDFVDVGVKDDASTPFLEPDNRKID